LEELENIHRNAGNPENFEDYDHIRQNEHFARFIKK
jgi:hypothetical protein